LVVLKSHFQSCAAPPRDKVAEKSSAKLFFIFFSLLVVSKERRKGYEEKLLIETDIILALIKMDDPLRQYAVKVFELENLILSPFSLLELNFLKRSGKIEIRDPETFTSSLTEIINSNGVRLIPDKPSYHHQASLLEREFRLTFFDSLHATVAKSERETLLSFDPAYDRAERVGVKRRDPRKL
jgi:predicted nucleic acid-binding protein